jgi:anti-sigma regulatory factor (Ser/Thr protein kinase)
MTPTKAPFRHEAVFYDGPDDFVTKIATFIAEGAAAGEPALVVVSAEKIDRLRDALGGNPGGVTFADMSNVGGNPARIIPAWREFVDEHAGAGQRFRGVGEEICAERTDDELVECQRHESLLNVPFADAKSFWLVCPYDTTTHPDAVLDEARRSHEYVSNGRAGELSKAYSGIEALAQPFSAALPDPPPGAQRMPVSVETLHELREMVAGHARAAGFDTAEVSDLVFVANEIASNSVVHAGGSGMFTIWRDKREIVCQSDDTGRIVHALVGRQRPTSGQVGGLGLWLANQLCDLVQIRTFADGSVVRVRMSHRG